MKYFILILTLLSASLTALEMPVRSYVIIWNVGQGQFISAVSSASCMHFDMGGEFFPWKKIFWQCRNKSNKAFLSHWDWDHIGALGKLNDLPNTPMKNLCIALHPIGASTKHKMKTLSAFPSCPILHNREPLYIWKPQEQKKTKDTNTLSQVLLNRDILIPGDSPVDQEKIWSHLPWVKQSRILILGHHGSKTSTSQELLNLLPNLKMAISSARWQRYHHPHALVEARLKEARIPLLRTEDWGNIWLEQINKE